MPQPSWVGHWESAPSRSARTTNALAAIVLELAHLLSDVGTRSGLPLPGWSIARMIDAGSIGGQTVGEPARTMYLRGFDSWRLLTMSMSVAAALEALLDGWPSTKVTGCPAQNASDREG